jgi:integrase
MEGKAYLLRHRAHILAEDFETIDKTSWDALLEQWIRIKEPQETRKHAHTIRLLKEHFGATIDCSRLTPSDIAGFRDKLVDQGISRALVEMHLTRTHAMFGAACREPGSPFHDRSNPTNNPAAGVRVLGQPEPPKEGRERAFTADQARHVLDTAARVKFGGNRHEDYLRMLRLIAFSGAGPGEISQLQGGDVCEEHGVKFFDIRNTDAVTGERHPEKSEKKKVRRRPVPLHPDVMDFFEHAQKFAKNEFIFGAFPYHKSGKRAHELISNFPRFLRDDCKIIDKTKKLTLYSFRHRFHNAMDEVDGGNGVPDKIQRRLVGHGKDKHVRYGGGELKNLAYWMAKIKPLG